LAEPGNWAQADFDRENWGKTPLALSFKTEISPHFFKGDLNVSAGDEPAQSRTKRSVGSY
jgi:hypothetical protein